MEASEEILLNSLATLGVLIPAGFSSVRDLTPPSLFALCSNALCLIDAQHYSSSSFPASLPEDSMPDRVKFCTELAHAFNRLGFMPELSFQKFLYPSEDDLYKLVRFLVGKLSESSVNRTDGDSRRCAAQETLGGDGETVQSEEISNGMKDLRLKNQAFESSHMVCQDDLAGRADDTDSVLQNVAVRDEDTEAKEQKLSTSECSRGGETSNLSEGVKSSAKNAFRDQDSSLHLNEELQLLKEAAEMVFGSQHPVVFHLDQLNDQVEAKGHKMKELELEWNGVEKALQEKKRNLEQSLLSIYPEASGTLMKIQEIDLETESILAEVEKREDQRFKLSSDLEKQPKLAPRKSYIERVCEISKNSRKQDNDIQRILKDTRELQLESNTIQESLNRTRAVVDETIFREAKKDPVARQAYRLLTNIHESFEQIAEKILATDRTRRDAADIEAKLAVLSTRSLNMGKLQEDLDAVRKENELLEQRLH